MGFTSRVPLEGNPGDRNMIYERIELKPTDQPIALKGWWMPAENAVASVLFIHGANGNITDPWFGTLDFYKALHDRKLNVLTLDLRNHGASGAAESGRLTFGREERHDAAAGINWLKRKTPELPIFGAGISMGGATLIHMAGNGVETNGLILVDPILDNQDVITRSLHAILEWPQILLEPSGAAAQWYYNDRIGFRDPAQVALELDTPVLLISDEYDPVTTVNHARALAKRSSSIELLVVPKMDNDNSTGDQGGWAGHVTAFVRQPDKVVAAIEDFVNQQHEK